jgi:hypothetical protein
MDWTERLARDLAEEGRPVEVDEATGEVVIHGFGDESWNPPVRLSVTGPSLEAHLASFGDEALDVFPDVSPLQAAYQLFSVHVDETLATTVVAGSLLRLEDGRLRADPEREFPHVEIPEGTGPLMYVSSEEFNRMMRDLRPLRSVRPQAVVTIGLADLVDPATGKATAELGFGATLSAARARWLACDAELRGAGGSGAPVG